MNAAKQMGSEVIYTIGHSTHPIEKFVELLKKHSITAVADVRSAPYSRMNPQYNQDTLRNELKNHSIKYVFLGKELGARPDDPSCYRDGKVQYDLLSNTSLFKNGLKRVKEGSKKYRVALMCAEKDPLQCHRTILVARNLITDGISVLHILSDGTIESQDQSGQRLLQLLQISPLDLYRSKDEILDDAFRKQGDAIAYIERDINEHAKA